MGFLISELILRKVVKGVPGSLGKGWKESQEAVNTTKDWVYDLLADPDGTSNAYLCMNAFSFRWEACDFYWDSYDRAHAYMCEERGATIKDTYKVGRRRRRSGGYACNTQIIDVM